MVQVRNSNSSANPIELIRQAEAEIKQNHLLAQKKAGELIKVAEKQAQKIVNEALDSGKREGDKKFAEEIEKAKGDAALVLEEKKVEADTLRMKGDAAINEAVNAIIQIVLPVEDELGEL